MDFGEKREVGREILSLSNLLYRKIEYDKKKSGIYDLQYVQGGIIKYIKENPQKDIFPRDIVKRFCLTRSTVAGILQKMEQNPLPNIKFICMDAADVAEVFAKDEVDRIYLNFSDPWPKDRHAKRRLTSRQFFARYDQILKKEGHLEFKTDNQDLFTFSLEEVPEAGWKLDASTRDLHHDPVLSEGNVMTEYEEKFSFKGNPICKLIASR